MPSILVGWRPGRFAEISMLVCGMRFFQNATILAHASDTGNAVGTMRGRPRLHTATARTVRPPVRPGGHTPRWLSISAISASTRSLISSRIGRTASTPLPAGSSRAQSRYFLPGKTGQVSPQPMVMT